jgi:hypothetical protein
MKKAKRFVGELAEPIVADWLAAGVRQRKDPQSFEKEGARLLKEQMRKLGLLAEHYGIPLHTEISECLAKLIICLAKDFVPGMQVVDTPARKAGRPPGAGMKIDKPKLYAAVEDLRRRRGLTIASACRHLANREWKGVKPASLETRYYEIAWELKNAKDLATKIAY